MIPIYDGEPCVPSPFGKANSRGGYVRISIGNGKYKMAHRIACEEAHGPAPEGKPIAGHTCGSPTCIRPSHLFWASVKENMAVCRSRHHYAPGEAHHRSKLTWDQVKQIRKDYIPRTATTPSNVMQLARDYGVAFVTMYAICYGKTWKED